MARQAPIFLAASLLAFGTVSPGAARAEESAPAGSSVENYQQSSVLSDAARLERPLLVIHGTDDDNVYFSHSLKLCNALQRAGKDFEFLPLIGFTHMVTDPLVTERLQERIAEFFLRELGNPRTELPPGGLAPAQGRPKH